MRTLLDELDSARLSSRPPEGKACMSWCRCNVSTRWDEVKTFSKALADHLVRQIPERFLATMSKQKRRGKIYVDYLRNARGATAVAAYSTRARPGAPVSVPLAWDELSVDMRSDHFTISNVQDRLRRLRKDPWKDYSRTRQTNHAHDDDEPHLIFETAARVL